MSLCYSSNGFGVLSYTFQESLREWLAAEIDRNGDRRLAMRPVI